MKDPLDEMNVAADIYDTLDAEVAERLEDAARRAKANNRKTVQPHNF